MLGFFFPLIVRHFPPPVFLPLSFLKDFTISGHPSPCPSPIDAFSPHIGNRFSNGSVPALPCSQDIQIRGIFPCGCSPSRCKQRQLPERLAKLQERSPSFTERLLNSPRCSYLDLSRNRYPPPLSPVFRSRSISPSVPPFLEIPHDSLGHLPLRIPTFLSPLA